MNNASMLITLCSSIPCPVDCVPQGERSQPTSMAEEAPEQPSRPPCPQDPPPPEENNSSPQVRSSALACVVGLPEWCKY